MIEGTDSRLSQLTYNEQYILCTNHMFKRRPVLCGMVLRLVLPFGKTDAPGGKGKPVRVILHVKQLEGNRTGQR